MFGGGQCRCGAASGNARMAARTHACRTDPIPLPAIATAIRSSRCCDEHFAECRHVLEIGSGTGQHAVHFAAAMPWLTWQCSDVADNLPGIRLWLDEAALAKHPRADRTRCARQVAASAGSRASMRCSAPTPCTSWVGQTCRACSPGWPTVLATIATLAVYGPFNYGGSLHQRQQSRFRRLVEGARSASPASATSRPWTRWRARIGLQLVADVAMPANNRTLIWRRERRASDAT